MYNIHTCVYEGLIANTTVKHGSTNYMTSIVCFYFQFIIYLEIKLMISYKKTPAIQDIWYYSTGIEGYEMAHNTIQC